MKARIHEACRMADQGQSEEALASLARIETEARHEGNAAVAVTAIYHQAGIHFDQGRLRTALVTIGDALELLPAAPELRQAVKAEREMILAEVS